MQNENSALGKRIQALTKENSPQLKDELMKKDRQVRELEQRVELLQREHAELRNMPVEAHMEDVELYQNENLKLKKINGQLLEEIKNLKMQLEKKADDNMYSSRVIELQN